MNCGIKSSTSLCLYPHAKFCSQSRTCPCHALWWARTSRRPDTWPCTQTQRTRGLTPESSPDPQVEARPRNSPWPTRWSSLACLQQIHRLVFVVLCVLCVCDSVSVCKWNRIAMCVNEKEGHLWIYRLEFLAWLERVCNRDIVRATVTKEYFCHLTSQQSFFPTPFNSHPVCVGDWFHTHDSAVFKPSAGLRLMNSAH